MLKRYLLSSVAFAPTEPSGADAGDEGDPQDNLDVGGDDTQEGDAPQPGADDGEQLADSGDPDGDGGEGDEPEDGADDQPDGQPARRGNRAIAALRADRRRQQAEIADANRRIAELQSQVARPPQETPQQRADRLALLAPEDRVREEIREEMRVHDARQQAVNRQLMDNSDRAAFNSMAASNPVAHRLAPEVERRLGALRAQGQDLPRHVVLTYLLGERALAQAGKAKPGAQDRQRRQQAPPVDGRGDRAPARQRQGGDTVSDIERNFGDVPI